MESSGFLYADAVLPARLKETDQYLVPAPDGALANKEADSVNDEYLISINEY